MPRVNCEICGKEFYVKPRHLRIGWGKYCSKSCHYIGMKTGKIVRCDTCGADVYRTKKELRGSKSGKYFCNRSCFAVWKNMNILVGEKNAHWIHGQNAYRNVMKRNGAVPICKNCGIKNLRVLVVHHIDHSRRNNRINNLMWLCRNCHYLAHDGKTL